MDRRLLIDILERLEQAYPKSYTIEGLRKIVNPTLGQGFFQIIKYLKDKLKIYYSSFESKPSLNIIEEQFSPKDEISINPDGIDFLNKLKSIQNDEKRNEIISYATIVLAISSFLALILTILNWGWNELGDKMGFNLAIIFVICFLVLLSFLGYLIFKIIIFATKR